MKLQAFNNYVLVQLYDMGDSRKIGSGIIEVPIQVNSLTMDRGTVLGIGEVAFGHWEYLNKLDKPSDLIGKEVYFQNKRHNTATFDKNSDYAETSAEKEARWMLIEDKDIMAIIGHGEEVK